MASGEVGVAPKVTVGALWRRSWSLLFTKPALFLGMAVLAAVLSFLLGRNFLSLRTSPSIIYATRLFIGSLFQGTAAYGVYQLLIGNKVGIITAIKRDAVRIIPIAILAAIVNFSLLIPGSPQFMRPSNAYLLFQLGITLANIYLKCIWLVAIPVCAVEGIGVIASLRRSFKLTKDHRWVVFCLYMIWILSDVCLAFSVLIITTIGNPLPPKFAIESSIVYSLILEAELIIFTAIWNVFVSVTYFSLRSEKEGVAVDRLTNVFD